MSRESKRQVAVLFVCLGNICRSPTAEGVFRAQAKAQGLQDALVVDSAGTAGYHIGEAPDRRARKTAATRGYRLDDLRGRQVAPADFEAFDYVLAMDSQNLQDLRALWQANDKVGVEPQLFLSYAEGVDVADVPDPYYGGEDGFAYVLDLCERGAEGLLADIDQRYSLPRRTRTDDSQGI